MTRKATSRAILAHFTHATALHRAALRRRQALCGNSFPAKSHSWLPPAAYDRDPIAVLMAQSRHSLEAAGAGAPCQDAGVPFAFLRGRPPSWRRISSPLPLRPHGSGLWRHACRQYRPLCERQAQPGAGSSTTSMERPISALGWDLKRLAASALVAAEYLRADAAPSGRRPR